MTIHALGADGNDVDATFLLGPGANLMVETANTATPEPDNADTNRYLADRTAELTEPHHITPSENGQDAIEMPPGY